MLTNAEKVFLLLKNNLDKTFFPEDLARAFDSAFGESLTKDALSSILSKKIRFSCLRSKTQMSKGFLYTYSNKKLLDEAYDEYLVPRCFQNKNQLLSLIKKPLPKYISQESSEISPFFALLLGFGLGDGSLRKHDGLISYYFFLRSDALRFSQEIFSRFGLRPNLSFHAGCFRLEFYNRSLHQKLQEMGFPKGNKVKKAFLVPQWVLIGSQEIKRSFLRGIFGAEGSKPFKGRRRIQLVLAKDALLVENLLLFLTQVRSLLLIFGIESTHIQLRKQKGRSPHARFYITGEKNIQLFHDELGFAYASEKQLVLEKLVHTFKDRALS